MAHRNSHRRSTPPVNDGSIESAEALGDWMRNTVDAMPEPWRTIADEAIRCRLDEALARLTPSTATVTVQSSNPPALNAGFPELTSGRV